MPEGLCPQGVSGGFSMSLLELGLTFGRSCDPGTSAYVHPSRCPRTDRGWWRHRRRPSSRSGSARAESGWLEPRGRGHGARALALHRVTGLVIVVYLYLHILGAM